uniref:Uncharacterized protein n=1 Tax=Babesia bovis TaxID=5865 RepID=S6BEE0_BABBO|nr:hypothetical protein [Babesia bovis]
MLRGPIYVFYRRHHLGCLPTFPFHILAGEGTFQIVMYHPLFGRMPFLSHLLVFLFYISLRHYQIHCTVLYMVTIRPN